MAITSTQNDQLLSVFRTPELRDAMVEAIDAGAEAAERVAATQAAIPALVEVPADLSEAAAKDDLDTVATKVNDIIAALKSAGLMET